MTLGGEEFKQLECALLSAFPKRFDLRRMVRFGIEGQTLEKISNGKNVEEDIFNLIDWADANGKIKQLLTAADKENPDNPELKCLCQQWLSQASQTAQSFPTGGQPEEIDRTYLDPWRFDLDEFIRNCMEQLLKEENQRGAIGLGIPYDVADFSNCVCQRLKESLGDDKIPYVGQPTKVEYSITNVSQLLKSIKRYEKKLTISDVIFPIQIDASKPNSKKMVADFWQQLIQSQFIDSIEHRLILVMFCSKKTFLPKCQKMIMQKSPDFFKKVDLHCWLTGVTKALGWWEIKEEWENKIIQECCCEGNQPDRLEIINMYLHLNRSLAILQERHNRNLTAQEFIDLI